MYTSGIIILVFTLISIILPLVFVKKLKIYLNKYYWIITIIAVFCFLYFLIGRWAWNIDDLIHADKIINNTALSFKEIKLSQLQSKVLLLDMCPLMAFLLPLFCLFRKTTRIALILCPITIIGSSITIFGQVIFENIDMNQFAKYFFAGIVPNRLFFMMHYLSFMLAIFILIANYRYTWKDLIYTLFFYFAWLFYVNIIIIALDIKANASGLVAYDWMNAYGEYHKMYLMWPLKFPQITAFWYFVILVVNGLIVTLKNVFTKKVNEQELLNIYHLKQINNSFIVVKK